MSDSTETDTEPQVRGLSLSMVSSLSGLAVLLMLAGVVCGVVAGWDQLPTWVRLAALLLPLLVYVVLHVLYARRQSLPMISPAFGALLLAQLLLPAGVYMAVLIAPWVGTIFAYAYALALLWYGSEYRSIPAVTAACALVFAACASLMVWLQFSAWLGALFFLMLGGCTFALSLRLRRHVAEKQALLHLALKRREAQASLTPTPSSAEKR